MYREILFYSQNSGILHTPKYTAKIISTECYTTPLFVTQQLRVWQQISYCCTKSN